MKRLTHFFVLKKIKEKNIKIFTALEFQRIFGVNYESAKKTLLRYTKTGLFTKARKGLYFLTDDSPNDFEIANRLYQPSYISFETALSFYKIIPETIFEITSATPRNSRDFIVNNLKFSYKKIKKECFFGYTTKKIEDRIFLVAEPEKALLDFLYFVALKKRTLSYERIDFKKIKKQKLINYSKFFKDKKIIKIIKNLYGKF